jgi:hypothetical protein
MRILKYLKYTYLIWWFNQRSANYMSYDWVSESFAAAQKAEEYKRKRALLTY